MGSGALQLQPSDPCFSAGVVICPGRVARGSVVDHNRVFGVLFVPVFDQVFAGVADEFAVEDGAAEGSGDVDAVVQGGVGAEVDREHAVEIDAGSEGAQPFHFDGATGAAVFDDVVAQFLVGLVDGALHQTSGAGEGADELGLLDGVALLDARTVGVDRLDSGCDGILPP